jgi:PAS domain S-box-containing protein
MDISHMINSSYMEHGFCLNWEPRLVFLHVGSDIITGISYYSIPLAMFYFAYRRRDIPFFKLFIVFAVFILACGTTHFLAAYVIYRPAYWIEGYVKAITALVSALGAVMFIPKIPEAIALPSLLNSMDKVKKLNLELGIKNDALQMANFSIENVNDAIYWILEDGRIFRVNEAACKTLGYTPDELKGLRISDLDPCFSQDQWDEHWRELKAKKSVKLETKHQAKNGSILDVEVVANFMEYQGEEFNCAIVRDITEHRKLEAQLQQTQKMESIGQLAGGVAHDFNNMLTVILGYGNMLGEAIPPDDPLQECVQEIVDAGIRSANIVRQLLAFARKQTIDPQVLDLNESIEEMLKMLRRLIGEDINLAWHPSTIWPVNIDPSQLDQLLANLCVNARDAIDGVGKVTIETGTTTFDEIYCLEHPGFTTGEFVFLSVSDNGIGMDSDTVSRIFEPFFTTKEVGKGTGLGLATVYGIIKQNNGFINVSSEPGRGTTFRIYLPRHSEQIAVLVNQNEDVFRSCRGETVLVVEDDASILKLTIRMLTNLGYAVVAAGSPEEALKLAEEPDMKINLLLTDVIMPEMNGRDLANRIVALHPNLKCLFMSGYSSTVIASKGVLEEGTYFIQKPFSVRDLGAKVNEVLMKSDEDKAS